jgi:hypothetical protein
LHHQLAEGPGLIVSQAPHIPSAIGPTFANLNPQMQHHLLFKQPLYVFARLDAY